MRDIQINIHDWNQPPEFAPCDLWQTDIALREVVAREGAQSQLEHWGERVLTAETLEQVFSPH